MKFGCEIIADSKRALLLIQYPPDGLPTYYFPAADVHLKSTEQLSVDAVGRARWDVRVGDKVAESAAWTYLVPPTALAALEGYVSFDWGRMDAWYEEGEEVFVHARDPYSRVDVVRSSRHVRVVVAGKTIAETTRPFLLFETRLPTRYYIPPEDIDFALLQPSHLKTRCPYKGTASYWTATVDSQIVKNVVWSYPDPIPECAKIRGLLSFFDERVDLYVDGELQERPQTAWAG